MPGETAEAWSSGKSMGFGDRCHLLPVTLGYLTLLNFVSLLKQDDNTYHSKVAARMKENVHKAHSTVSGTLQVHNKWVSDGGGSSKNNYHGGGD